MHKHIPVPTIIFSRTSSVKVAAGILGPIVGGLVVLKMAKRVARVYLWTFCQTKRNQRYEMILYSKLKIGPDLTGFIQSGSDFNVVGVGFWTGRGI